MQNLKNTFKKYAKFYPTEKEVAEKFIVFLERNGEKAFIKRNLEWHFTGSVFVVNKDFSKTLLMHHKKLWVWLNFWWHADGDIDLENVAVRELEEEAGIKITKQDLMEDCFDLELQTIEKWKNAPKHLHFDIRYLVTVDDDIIFEKQETEVNDIRWFDIDKIEEVDVTNWVKRILGKLEGYLKNKEKI